MIDHTILLLSNPLHVGDKNDCYSCFLAVFGLTSEYWTKYNNIEHLQVYLAANGITDAAKQHAVLLSCFKPSTFRLLQSVTSLSE